MSDEIKAVVETLTVQELVSAHLSLAVYGTLVPSNRGYKQLKSYLSDPATRDVLIGVVSDIVKSANVKEKVRL